MRIEINLASRPFRRDRPVIVGSVAVGALLTATLALLATLGVVERGQSKATRLAIEQLEAELRTTASEQAKVEAVLRKPENAEVLERSVFLNSLLLRKGISWTKIFSDLEHTIPHNVRVIAIRPWLNARNEVRLEMTVGSEQTEPMLKLLMALESSEVFGSTEITSTQPPSQTEPMFRYKVNVNYAQKF